MKSENIRGGHKIPKIIHYSWFSGEEYPEDIKACMDTWKTVLPDYEFVLWDAQKLAELNNIFSNEAVSVRKWAFASDFVRLYAVYTYGGIWLDTDIEMYKSFDPYLDHRLFIGREGNEDWNCSNHSTVSLLTSHCFGAEPGHPYLKMCLDFYNNRHFIRCLNDEYPQHLKYDMLILPRLQAEIAFLWGYKWDSEHDTLQELEDGMVVYPHDYFDYPKYTDMKNVVCIHRQFGGWRPNNKGHHKSYEATHNLNNFKLKFLRRSLLVINKFLYTVGVNLKFVPRGMK